MTDPPEWKENVTKPDAFRLVLIRVRLSNGITNHSFSHAAFNGAAWRVFNGGLIPDSVVTHWMEVR